MAIAYWNSFLLQRKVNNKHNIELSDKKEEEEVVTVNSLARGVLIIVISYTLLFVVHL